MAVLDSAWVRVARLAVDLALVRVPVAAVSLAVPLVCLPVAFVGSRVASVGLPVAFIGSAVPPVCLVVAFVSSTVSLIVARITIVLPFVQPPLSAIQYRGAVIQRRGTQDPLSVALLRVDLPLFVGSLHAENIAQAEHQRYSSAY
ncbi:hypothetical protein [Couchioplanes caeruleus]|uniref:hypothetical protein n=1 Tax=Couchioplanes caeruleus TaxID=56438 RepID=UPI0011602B3C|nr:hypothetical protein [Couchioplanes caeruleus]